MRVLLAEDEKDLNRIKRKSSPPKDTVPTAVLTEKKL